MKKRFLHAKAFAFLCVGLFSQNLFAQQNTAWSTTANIGIGTITVPTNPVRLNVTSNTVGSSGLRFGNFNSASTPSATNGKLLSVNATGDIILTNSLSSVGLSMPSGFAVTGSPVTTTGTLAVTTTLNGLIRGNGSGFVATTVGTGDIANSAVTYAKIQNVTNGRLLGRGSAGAGSAEEINLGTGLAISGGALNVVNIYNSNGTITGPRVVSYNGNGNYLEFRNLNGGRLFLDDGIELSTPNGGITLITDGGDILLNGSGNAVTQTAEVINITSTSSSINLHGGNGISATSNDVNIVVSDNITNSQIHMVAGNMSLMAPVIGVGTATPNGNVKLDVAGKAVIGTGITSYPAGYNLYVSGGILTAKIKAALANGTQWSDYVFENDYKLKSLAEVETFINKNKHLPGVPSADELVKDGGIDMNEMFAKQMEKIEELTLYIIQQNKQIVLMKSQISKLQLK